MTKNITSQTIQRLPVYLNFLRSLPEEKKKGNISATAIAEALGLNDVQVRKDLACISSGGRPKIGYCTSELISDLGRFLGFENRDSVIVAGMGNLGKAMMEFGSFADYGFDVVCGFDRKDSIAGTTIGGKPVLHIRDMKEYCQRENIRIGIITVPAKAAQEVCQQMADAGIRYILNFAAVHLNSPEGTQVHNENISITLAMLVRGSK